MNIYIYADGEKGGPFSRDTLRKELLMGKVKPSTLVWHSRLTEWVPLKSLPLKEAELEDGGEVVPFVMPDLPTNREKRVKVRRIEQFTKPTLRERFFRLLGVAR